MLERRETTTVAQSTNSLWRGVHVCGRKTELGRGRAWWSRKQLSGEEEELTQLLQSMAFASGDGRKKVQCRKTLKTKKLPRI